MCGARRRANPNLPLFRNPPHPIDRIRQQIATRLDISWVPSASAVEAPLETVQRAILASREHAPQAAGGTRPLVEQARSIVANDCRGPGERAPIGSRDDVMLALRCACYLERTEPGHPAPLLIRRAQRLMHMTFYEIVRDMAPAALPQLDVLVGRTAEQSDICGHSRRALAAIASQSLEDISMANSRALKANATGQKFIARNRAPRVQIEYDVEIYGSERKVEIPFVMGVIADLAGKSTSPCRTSNSAGSSKIDVDNFDERLKSIQPRVALHVANEISGDGLLAVDLTFESMEDFSPASIARQVPALNQLLEARLQLSNLLSYMDGKSGAEELITQTLKDPTLLKTIWVAPAPRSGESQ